MKTIGRRSVASVVSVVLGFSWVSVFTGLGRAVVVVAENHYAMTHVTVAGLRFDAWPHVNLFVLVNGLILLVIAEVFRAGTRLDEEQSLTI